MSESVLHFHIPEEDDTIMMDVLDPNFVRAVVEDLEGGVQQEYQEVILDSGADCTVVLAPREVQVQPFETPRAMRSPKAPTSGV